MYGVNRGWKFVLAGALFVGAGLVPVTSMVVKAQSAPAQGEVTFTKDIAPILQRTCQNCHRSDGVPPMSRTTYEQARPYARAMKQKTGLGPHAGVMPPWYLEKNIGIQKFQ